MGVSTPLVLAFGTFVLAFGTGLSGFAFGGPIVHWAHGHVGKGFGALGLNVGLTSVGGLVGVAAICSGGCNGEWSGLTQLFGFVIGGGVGLLSANIIDVAALSYETVGPAAEEQSRRRRHPGLTVVPQVGWSPQQSYFGVAGSF
jgi:hypothetical protein